MVYVVSSSSRLALVWHFLEFGIEYVVNCTVINCSNTAQTTLWRMPSRESSLSKARVAVNLFSLSRYVAWTYLFVTRDKRVTREVFFQAGVLLSKLHAMLRHGCYVAFVCLPLR